MSPSTPMLKKSLLSLIYILFINLTITKSIANSVSITPLNPNLHGITTTLTNATIIDTKNHWNLYGINNPTFNIKLHLNKSWSFHPQNITTLKFQIDSDQILNYHHNSSLIITFSQQNSQYFSFILQTNPNDDHLITPLISDQLDIDKANQHQILEQLTDNSSSTYFESIQSSPFMTYPLTFTLQNHPNQQFMIFRYSNPSIITPMDIELDAMYTDSSMDIYLTTLHQGDMFDISYFNITHFIHSEPEISENNGNDIATTNPPTLLSTQTDSNERFITFYIDKIHLILICAIVIMCCVCLGFTFIFYKMIRHHTKKKIVTTSNELTVMPQLSPISVATTTDSPKLDSIQHSVTFNNQQHLRLGTNPWMIPSFTATSYNSTKSVISELNSNVDPDEEEKDIIADMPSKSTIYRRPRLNTGERDHDLPETPDIPEDEGDTETDDETQDGIAEEMYAPPTAEDVRRATTANVHTPGGHGGDMNDLLRLTSPGPDVGGYAVKEVVDSHKRNESVLVMEDNVNVNRISVNGSMRNRASLLSMTDINSGSGDSEAIYGSGADGITVGGEVNVKMEETSKSMMYSPDGYKIGTILGVQITTGDDLEDGGEKSQNWMD